MLSEPASIGRRVQWRFGVIRRMSMSPSRRSCGALKTEQDPRIQAVYVLEEARQRPGRVCQVVEKSERVIVRL
jgi:hypothetical protein